jgi:ABC-type nitrate/sulfonate/bicarbonate transport system substrate-binding protein
LTAVGVGATLALILVLQGCSSSGASSGNASSGGGGATAGGGDTSAASSAAASAATITVDGVAFPKPEKSSVSMGVSSIDVGVMPTYLITEQQIAQKFGINLKIHDFNGEAPTLQAMIAGQIDVSAGSGGIAYSSHTTHDPAVITFVGDDTVTDILASQHDITSADSLKGKSIAVSSFGSYSYAEALLALKSLGLTPKDVTLTAVGHDSDRLAALKAHSVGASIQDATITGQLKSEGYNILVDLAKIKSAGYVGNAITVPESFA